MTNPSYKEVQYFRHPLFLLLNAFIIPLNVWAVVQQLILGIPWGNNPASDELLIIITLLAGVLLPIFLLTTHLTVIVDREGVRMKYSPFHRRTRLFTWKEIARYEVVDYSPIEDFGGWGIRYGGWANAYTVSGKRGVLLHLTGGETILIGSRQPEALSEAMAKLSKQ